MRATVADRCPYAVANASQAESSGPLTGIVVADFSRVLAGPYCTMLLADLGADVIKVERPPATTPGTGCRPTRGEVGTYYLAVNRNKRSIVLDFADPDDIEVAHALSARADAQPHRFPCQAADVGSILPCGSLFSRVAVHRFRVGQRESGDRRPGSVLNLDTEAAGGRGCIVQQQVVPGECDRLGSRLAAGQAGRAAKRSRRAGSCSVAAGIASRQAPSLKCIAISFGSPGLVRFRLEQAVTLVVVAVDPAAFGCGPGAQESLVPTVERPDRRDST